MRVQYSATSISLCYITVRLARLRSFNILLQGMLIRCSMFLFCVHTPSFCSSCANVGKNIWMRFVTRSIFLVQLLSRFDLSQVSIYTSKIMCHGKLSLDNSRADCMTLTSKCGIHCFLEWYLSYLEYIICVAGSLVLFKSDHVRHEHNYDKHVSFLCWG